MPAIKPGDIIPTNWLSRAVFYVDIMLSDQGFSLFDIRFRTSSGDKTNTATEAKQLRRQIARIKTIQHERQLKKN